MEYNDTAEDQQQEISEKQVTSSKHKPIVWDLGEKQATSNGEEKKGIKFTKWIKQDKKKPNSNGTVGMCVELPRLTGNERVGQPGSIFSFPKDDLRDKLNLAKFENSENWKAPVEEGSECSEKWKNWKNNSTEKENKNTTEGEKGTTKEIETELEEGTEQEMKAGSEGKEDPYSTYMKNPAGNMLGRRSENIKRMNQLKKMVKQNPELNEHQSGFVSQEDTQSENETRSQIEARDKEEERRFIDELIEQSRHENDEETEEEIESEN